MIKREGGFGFGIQHVFAGSNPIIGQCLHSIYLLIVSHTVERKIMEERRRHKRLNISLPVILRHGGRIIPATALNISCGGMFIRAEQAGVTGDGPVEVIFDLTEGEKDVSMRGNITRTEDSSGHTNLGVQFTNLFSLAHKAIERYLRNTLN